MVRHCRPAHARRFPDRLLILWLVLGIGLLLSLPGWAEVRLRVGVYENPPKIGLAANGQPQGIFIDILAAIATVEDWHVEYVPGTWNEGLARLTAGEIDLMPGVAHSAERERMYLFHREPVLSDWSQIYAPRNTRIHVLPDLQG